jgi:hypothetical protein
MWKLAVFGQLPLASHQVLCGVGLQFSRSNPVASGGFVLLGVILLAIAILTSLGYYLWRATLSSDAD